MHIYHNSQKTEYRKPFGAVRCGEEIKLSVKLSGSYKNAEVYTVLDIEGKDIIKHKMSNEINNNFEIFSCTITAPVDSGLLWYFFEIHQDGYIIYYGNNQKGLGGWGEIYHETPKPYQITVYPVNLSTPDWFKGTLVYQIFVDRFCNGNEDGSINNPKKNSFLYSNWNDTPVYIRKGEDILRWEFFGGNLKGVLKKLDYLKSLGVGAVYLNPVFEARSNHKYDTGNYKKIDSMFGDNEIFKNLCSEADKRGIAIILDGVFSHTGADSIYFNKFKNYDSTGAFQSEESLYYSWYKFREYPDDYECWWGVKDLPNVNELEPSYVDYIIGAEDSVINYWMKIGCKGWRLDVADELPDEFLKKLREAAKTKNPDAVIIGEVWEDASNKISYGSRKKYFTSGLLDSTTNYPLRTAIIDFVMGKTSADNFNASVMSLYENYPKEVFYSTLNLIGGHDVPRIISVLTGVKASSIEDIDAELYNLTIKRFKLAVLLQMTIPGSPCLYYADEAGAFGYDEPENRGTYPWGRENGEILNWYKTVTEIRSKYQCLKTGSWKVIATEGSALAFIRFIRGNADEFRKPAMNQAIIIVTNPCEIDESGIELDLREFNINELKDMLCQGSIVSDNGCFKLDIDGFGYKLLDCRL